MLFSVLNVIRCPRIPHIALVHVVFREKPSEWLHVSYIE